MGNRRKDNQINILDICRPGCLTGGTSLGAMHGRLRARGGAPRRDAGRGACNRRKAWVRSQAGFGQSAAGPRTTEDELPGDARKASGGCATGFGSGGDGLGGMHATMPRDTYRGVGRTWYPRARLRPGCGRASAPWQAMCLTTVGYTCQPRREREARCRMSTYVMRCSAARGAKTLDRASGNRHRASGNRGHPAGQLRQCYIRTAARLQPCGTGLRPRSCTLPAATRLAAPHHPRACPRPGGVLPHTTRWAAGQHAIRLPTPPDRLPDTTRWAA